MQRCTAILIYLVYCSYTPIIANVQIGVYRPNDRHIPGFYNVSIDIITGVKPVKFSNVSRATRVSLDHFADKAALSSNVIAYIFTHSVNRY